MSDCTIDNYGDDGECVVLKHKKCKARKKHICGECDRDILRGETYEFYNGRFEGDFFCAKTCSDCISLRESFFHGGYTFGLIREDILCSIDDSGGEVDSACIVNLTPTARDFVFATMERVWEEQYAGMD